MVMLIITLIYIYSNSLNFSIIWNPYSDLFPDILTFQLGPNGYSFAINTNGYIVFHPHLKAQVQYMLTASYPSLYH